MPTRRHILSRLVQTTFSISLLAATTQLAIGPALAQDKIVMKAADVHPAGYPNVVALETMGKKLSAALARRLPGRALVDYDPP